MSSFGALRSFPLAVLLLLGTTCAQTSPPAAQRDIVRVLMPDDLPLKKVPAGSVPRDQAIQELTSAKKDATGKRALKIAFLLAIEAADYPQNRDYLLNALQNCKSPASKNPCDEDSGVYLVSLYRRGHLELLQPLLDAGQTRHAALAELLGNFYSGVISHSAASFLAGIGSLPPAEQKNLCYMAGAADGSGMPSEDLKRTRQSLRAINSEVARQCLMQVEEANKKL